MLNEAKAHLDTKKQMLLRLLILGNAGGTIATLSFIGTLLSTSSDHKIDGGALMVLIYFLVGLSGGWLVRMADWNIADIDLELVDLKSSNAREKCLKRRRRWEQVVNAMITLMFTTIGMGIFFGIAKLFELVR